MTVIAPGKAVRIRPSSPLYAGREARLESVTDDGRWVVVFTEFQLLGKSYVCDPDHVCPITADKTRVRGDEVRSGDLIGIGPGLGLRVEQTIFDGDDGLLVGRAECEGKVVDTRHGTLRDGQPYAAVVTASGILRRLEGYRPPPVVIW